MLRRRWRIVDRGQVPDPPSYTVEFDCPRCDRPALLPVLGCPVAETGGGIIFDPGEFAMPRIIRCPSCRRSFTSAQQEVA